MKKSVRCFKHDDNYIFMGISPHASKKRIIKGGLEEFDRLPENLTTNGLKEIIIVNWDFFKRNLNNKIVISFDDDMLLHFLFVIEKFKYKQIPEADFLYKITLISTIKTAKFLPFKDITSKYRFRSKKPFDDIMDIVTKTKITKEKNKLEKLKEQREIHNKMKNRGLTIIKKKESYN